MSESVDIQSRRGPESVAIAGPAALATLRRLAESPGIAGLSDRHIAAIRWAIDAIDDHGRRSREWDAERMRAARWRDRMRAAIDAAAEAVR